MLINKNTFGFFHLDVSVVGSPGDPQGDLRRVLRDGAGVLPVQHGLPPVLVPLRARQLARHAVRLPGIVFLFDSILARGDGNTVELQYLWFLS